MVSRAGWATVAATGVRATTVGQRRGAWASDDDDDDDDERTAADGNVLASATVVEVRRVRHDEAGGRRVQATPSTSRMGGTRATADRRAGRVQARRVGGSGARSSRGRKEGGGGWAVACARRVCGGVMGRHVARGGRRQ